ncbi:MAG: hypothetical protein JWM81_661 [Candidatus Saccharibacteria bacterium]|nr:hypothetical protein [Candidatus Saccharibacteria bacterium]
MDERGLGKRIQGARQAAGFTQQSLCQKANLSFSTLTKIERGAIKSPSIFTIQSIAGALNLSLDALVGSSAVSSNTPQRNLHRSKSGVSFVYFDVNGCLVRFYERAFARIAADYDVPADVVEMAFWHYNDDACRGLLSVADFNKAMSERIGIQGLDWAPYYLDAAESIIEMHELVRWTADNYKVGLLTNIMPGLLGSLKELGKVPALPYDVVVDSSTIGLIKPELALYESAVKQAGVPADQILFVDDTKSNLIAAESLDWHVAWFDYARPAESAAQIRQILEPVA